MADLDGGTEERKIALAKDAHLRLMLKLLSFERSDEEIGETSSSLKRTRLTIAATEQKWYIPTSVLPSNLSASLGALRQYLASPPTIDDPKSLLRKVRAPRPAKKRQYSFDFSDEEFNQPKVQRKRKTAEMQFYKSAAFIDDSDDDEAADMAFFAREKTLREEMMAFAEKNGGSMLGQGTKRKRGEKKGKGKGKGKNGVSGRGKGRAQPVSDEEEDGPEDVEMRGPEGGIRRMTVESEEEEEDVEMSEEEIAPVKSTRRRGLSSGSEGAPAAQVTQKQRSKRIISSDSEDE